MSADGHDFNLSTAEREPAFPGLQGVEELLSSPGLEVLRQQVDAAELRALMEIARIVALHDATMDAAR